MKYLQLLLVLFTTLTFSQTNFIKGSITTNGNQVIEGLINYQDWKQTPETIEFKTGNEIKVYHAKNLLSFQVENDKFISRLVTIDITPQKIQQLDKKNKPVFEDKRVFLNVLIEGKANLYEYYDSRPHFFANQGDYLFELINRRYLAEDNVDIFVLKKYIGQLNILFNDCKKVSVSDALEYKRKQLTKIFDAYNSCDSASEQKAYKKEFAKHTNAFYVIIGYFSSELSYESKTVRTAGIEGGSLSTPYIGIAYEIGISKNNNKWSLFNELFYNSYSQVYKNETPISSLVRYDPFEFEISTIALGSLFRYKFYKENRTVVPYLNVGPIYNFVISDNSNIIETSSLQTRTLEIESSGHFSLTAGIGVIYKKFFIELRYNATTKVINGNSPNKINSFGLLASYKLFN